MRASSERASAGVTADSAAPEAGDGSRAPREGASDLPGESRGNSAGEAVAEASDADLARLTAEGRREAAAELIGRYEARVRGFLRRLTGRMDLADDLAQETFIRMLRSAHRYDPKYPMHTWLLTIARRLSINYARKADQKVKPTEYEGLRDGDEGPAQVAAKRDERRALRRVLDEALVQLTEAQRSVVVMFHQQGMSVEEVGEALDMPKGTVKSHLHRGRAALRKILGPQMGQPQDGA